MATASQINLKLRGLNKRALGIVGEQVIAEVLPFVPIASGDLRRSGRVEFDGENLLIIFGDRKTNKYALTQYFKALRHLGDRNSGFESLLDGAQGGGGNKSRYQRAYRAARKSGRLTINKAKWFEIVTKDKAMLAKLANIYTNVMKRL